MASNQSALELRGLTKRFDRPAVDALDLTVRTGEFYALLGPNGAGKTTTLRMVAGLLRPDAGSVSVMDIDALNDPVAAKQITAWVSDEPMIYDKLTPLEYLEFVAGLWGVDPSLAERSARELLVSLGLEANLHERCEGFSKGMRQKVALAGRAGARSAPDHSRRTVDRSRRRVGASRQGTARRARARRLHRHHDHAYSRSRRAHGGPHRRHLLGAATSPKARWPNCGNRTAKTTPASRTCSSRLSTARPPPHDHGRRWSDSNIRIPTRQALCEY